MSPKPMNTKHLLMYLLLAVGGSWLPLGTPALAVTRRRVARARR